MAGIGKTRHGANRQGAETEQRFDPAAGQPRGVLRGAATAGRFRHGRHGASTDLAHAIDHYWTVHWDLRGEPPQVVQTLPHPNFHLVFEKPHTTVNGVHTGKFSRALKGLGQAFGIKFLPGAFRPLLDAPASSLANRSVPAENIFAADEIAALEAVLLSDTDDGDKVNATESFLRRHISGPDPMVASAAEMVRLILNEPEIRTVEDLAARAGMGKRSLQRFFSAYVGAAPKWVIRRYRLHELVEHIHAGVELDYAGLAQNLGYFDQAHLIRDFKSIVGYSPARYGKHAAGKR